MGRAILFLDIDGVLHPNGVARVYVRRSEAGDFLGHRVLGSGLWQWSEPLASLLREYPEVEVVLHSTWRHEISLEDIKKHMPPELAERVTALTPKQVPERLDSIRAFCTTHAVERFVVVDDSIGQFPTAFAQLVPCGERGLSDPATIAALRAKLERMFSQRRE